MTISVLPVKEGVNVEAPITCGVKLKPVWEIGEAAVNNVYMPGLGEVAVKNSDPVPLRLAVVST